ncbi:MAG: reverse transcriptase domain-containing protein [Ignavibacteriales bacterium]|nr:reverse transcriptase domain-containing protein [Ignavibacteriales bacterium]
MTVDELAGLPASSTGRPSGPSCWTGPTQPQPVKRVEIPKPGGGTRKLGMPDGARPVHPAGGAAGAATRLGPDLLASTATGSARTARAHQARGPGASSTLRTGYRWVVDLDLEKFFDRVNHDQLMGRRGEAGQLTSGCCSLIRAFLNAGVMENGLVSPTDEGTPQGGPLVAAAVEPRAR